ncbi:MAG: 3-dehydroquinate dehydratase [Actinomycetota bacterium]|nr:3-dehydroquinate dehydratase [Actinomycetota bacterium]
MPTTRNRVEVMHGANLDMLATRDPEHYGTFSLTELEARIEGWARAAGLNARFFQTNHEGEFIEHLHRVPETADAVIVNAGSWTHYSWAIRDALELAAVPAVEVHLSDVMAREEWRHFSVFDGLVMGALSGKGADGYREALDLLAKELGA